MILPYLCIHQVSDLYSVLADIRSLGVGWNPWVDAILIMTKVKTHEHLHKKFYMRHWDIQGVRYACFCNFLIFMHFVFCHLWSVPECGAFRPCQMSKDSHTFTTDVLSARLQYCFLCSTTVLLWMSAMLSQGFECWLRCQDQLNACSDKQHDSHSRPASVWALRYVCLISAHVYFTWSRQWAVRNSF